MLSWQIQRTLINYNKKIPKISPPPKKKPIKWAHGKLFVTPVSFKLLTRFRFLNVREFRQNSIGEGFKLIEWVLRVLYNTASKIWIGENFKCRWNESGKYFRIFGGTFDMCIDHFQHNWSYVTFSYFHSLIHWLTHNFPIRFYEGENEGRCENGWGSENKKKYHMTNYAGNGQFT